MIVNNKLKKKRWEVAMTYCRELFWHLLGAWGKPGKFSE